MNFVPAQFDSRTAKKFFRRLSTKTSYGSTFGHKPSSDDTSMIKRNKFSDLPLS